ARALRGGSRDRGRHDDRRDRRPTGSRGRRVREGAHDETGDRIRGRSHGAQRPSHGPRRRHHLGLRRHRRREGGDHALGGAHRRAEPRGARRHGRAGAGAQAVATGHGPAVSAARAGRPSLVVTRRLPAAVEQQLTREFDARLNPDDRALSAAELQAALTSADALLPTVTDRLTAQVLQVEPLRTKILANFGVGFNHIDVAAAKARGLVVTNTPDVLTDDTADDAVMLMLMVARRAGEGERHVRSRQWTGWRPTHMLGARVSGKTLGLVGMGRIARAVARRAHCGFGMRVGVHEREPQVTPELLTMENVVLLPHLGSATLETRVAMGLRALENLQAFFSGAAPRDRVV